MYNLCGILFCCLPLLHHSFGKAAAEISLAFWSFPISALIILGRRVDRKHEIKLEIKTAITRGGGLS